MMPDFSPEFSVDGLNWHQNLTYCWPQESKELEVHYKKEDYTEDTNIKDGAFEIEKKSLEVGMKLEYAEFDINHAG